MLRNVSMGVVCCFVGLFAGLFLTLSHAICVSTRTFTVFYVYPHICIPPYVYTPVHNVHPVHYIPVYLAAADGERPRQHA